MSKRSIYSDLDKQVFLEILKKFKHVIEAKGSNSSSLREKSEAWSLIVEEFNNSHLISTKVSVIILDLLSLQFYFIHYIYMLYYREMCNS